MRKGPRAAILLALCCTAAAGLTGCGGPARDGYVAVGAAAPGPERGAGENVAPQGQVEFQPLGGPSAAGGSSVSSSTSASTPGSQVPGGSAPGGGTTTGPGGSVRAPGTAPGAGPSTTAPGTPGSPGSPGTPNTPSSPPAKPGTTPPAPPATPAKLTLSTPVRAAADDRWCERVTVTFTNTGTAAARSGTVGFATHIIGALGIDWATITTAQPLPAPIAGGATKTQTYTVCVEAWRVPLGMHVETRQVTATWN
ncbi:hypothetical protein J7E99_22995 [Streptomyces sp. ISL-44]|uniref:hypothetical protein n=1 Tax=Streptomyces sp. ISL-44 TaxID=2819184 RepID=UPI001BECD7FA|nr:hypothetical protein [Streptomyces sp. ISL-44]MBT2543486.1 hypothetical protein [Streptomyces sp. ISL-44]